MSPLAIIIIAWAAVYAYVAWYCHALYVRQPDREYLVFSLLALSVAVYAISAAFLQEARSVADAALAIRILTASAHVAVGWFVHFAYLLMGSPRSPSVRLGHAIAFLSVCLAVTGLVVDPHIPHTQRLWDLPWARPFPPVRILPWMLPVMLAVGLLLARTAVDLIRYGGSRRELRTIAWASSIAVLAALHDILMYALPLGSVGLTEHAFLFIAVGMGYRLLQQFLQTRAALQTEAATLSDHTEHLEQMQRQLVRQQQLAAVGELSSIIAKKLRTPMIAIEQAVHELQQAAPDPARDRWLDCIDEEADRLNRLVRDLLTYTRPMTPFLQPCDPQQVISRAVGALQIEAESRGLEVDVAIQHRELIDMDPDLVHLALVNLLDNALQATPDRGTVRIHTRQVVSAPHTYLCIEVSDSGSGMGSATQARAKDPFYTTRPSGTGLGLTLVERVAEVQNGYLDLYSTPDHGTQARLCIPYEQTTDPPSASVELSATDAR